MICGGFRDTEIGARIARVAYRVALPPAAPALEEAGEKALEKGGRELVTRGVATRLLSLGRWLTFAEMPLAAFWISKTLTDVLIERDEAADQRMMMDAALNSVGLQENNLKFERKILVRPITPDQVTRGDLYLWASWFLQMGLESTQRETSPLPLWASVQNSGGSSAKGPFDPGKADTATEAEEDKKRRLGELFRQIVVLCQQDQLGENTLGVLEEACALSIALGQKLITLMLLSWWGGVLHKLNRPDEALQRLDEAYQRAVSEDIPELVARIAAARGDILAEKKRFDEAADAYQKALEIYERLGNLEKMAHMAFFQGKALSETGRWFEAVVAFQTAYSSAEALGDKGMMARAAFFQMKIFFDHERWGEIIKIGARTQAQLIALGLVSLAAHSAYFLGRALLETGQLEKGMRPLEKARQGFTESGDSENAAICVRAMVKGLLENGITLLMEREFSRAVEIFQRAHALLSGLEGEKDRLASISLMLGTALYYDQKFEEATGYLNQAKQSFEELGDADNANIAEMLRAKALAGTGSYGQSAEILRRVLEKLKGLKLGWAREQAAEALSDFLERRDNHN